MLSPLELMECIFFLIDKAIVKIFSSLKLTIPFYTIYVDMLLFVDEQFTIKTKK